MKPNTTPFGAELDHEFMGHALQEAQRASAEQEVPIGAVLIDAQGEIIARAHNQVEQRHTQLAHAECQVLMQAGQLYNNWRLENCWLYVTLEPCAMCMYALVLSRVAGVVYGARSPLFGYQLDKDMALWVYNRGSLRIIADVREQESAELLKQFFIKHRKKEEHD